MAGAVYTAKEPMQVIKTSVQKLLLPYIITIGICVVIAYLFGNTERVHSFILGLLFPDGNRFDYTIFAKWPHVGALWFFPALVCCRTLYSIVNKYCNQYTIITSAIIQFSAAMVGRYLFNLPFGILVGSSVLFFFAVGKYVVENDINRKDIKLLVLLLLLNIWLLEVKHSSFSIMYFWYKSSTYIIDVFVAISMTWLIYRISKYLEKSCILNIIGRETLLILCCHEIVRQMINNLEYHNISFGQYEGAAYLIGGTALLSMFVIGFKHIIIKRKQTIELCKK